MRQLHPEDFINLYKLLGQLEITILGNKKAEVIIQEIYKFLDKLFDMEDKNE